MYAIFLRKGLPLLTIALAWTFLATVGRADGPGSAVAIKKALDQKITLDFQTQDLNDAIEHLRHKTKINFVVDNLVLQLLGFGPGGGFPNNPINLKSDNGKVRTALQEMLNKLNLTYVIVGDSVLITAEDMGVARQMRQRVNIDAKDVPLTIVLKQLSDDTGANLVIDPRQAAKAKAKITLQLEDVTLETAVRLLTEVGDLNSVRIGNVLFITSDERADKLRKENPPNSNPNPYDLLMPPKVGFGFGAGMPGFGGFGGIGGAVAPPRVVPPPPPPLQVPPPKKEEAKKPFDDSDKYRQVVAAEARAALEAAAAAYGAEVAARQERLKVLAAAGDLKGFRNPPPVYLKGKVQRVDKSLVKISLGSDQGVKKGNTLEVYRPTPEVKYLGRLLIVDADFLSSIGRLIVQPGVPTPTLLLGDEVVSTVERRRR